ncbi:MAG: hypothetical protein PHP92_05040 [Candidatus Nanoarchaeia archaeon]|nr:hypothetical protein [Candidatus Nanoarchaeia archaeon]
MNDLYVMFDGEETEKEFLNKCLEQWGKSCNAKSDIQKLIILGSLFAEIKHRVNEMDE